MGKLLYFPAYGRAEPTRMLLHHAGVQFEDEAVAFADWPTKKATMPNGQMPVWIDEAGNVLSQSISILNALAREHGYEPKGLLGNWANSWVSDTIADFAAKGHFSNIMKPEVSEENLKKWVDDTTNFLALVENHLAKWQWKYCAGENLTASDFHLYGYLAGSGLVLNSNHKKHLAAAAALAATFGTPATPHLNAWAQNMHEELKNYMELRPQYNF